MILNVNAVNGNYNVIIEKGCLNRVENYFNLNRKVLIVSDDGVPSEYIRQVEKKCLNPFVYIIKQGETSKNFENYKAILEFLIDKAFTRRDAIVAVGGGVVGDLSGFVASTYMRGIDFYNIPTTLLSQVDSSIGGKTAIDFGGIKNVVGAFYQPVGVLIDPLTLCTLDERQRNAGLFEAIKMAATCDLDLFEFIESSTDFYNDIEEIIYRSLKIKKDVVEKDALESGLRKILNFGHTIGHAVESLSKGELLHGECVAIGMLYMTAEPIRPRLKSLLEKYGLPTYRPISSEKIVELIKHDKKAAGNKVDIIYVETLGSYIIKRIEIEDIFEYLQG